MENPSSICEKCKGTGRVKEADGSIHTCFDCLFSGRMDQHDKKIKDAEELGIKLLIYLIFMVNNFFVSDEKELEAKILAFSKGGVDLVHVVSDFDRTLTHAFYNGEKTPSLISHLRNGNYLTADYAGRARQLANTYHPIEISTRISKKEKSQKMFEWWKKHYELLVECGLDEAIIKRSVTDLIEEGKLRFREGVTDFFAKTYQYGIPVLVMSSAGIGNMVTEFLRQQRIDYDNIHFLGNTLEFDQNGIFKGIADDKIIHSFNKSEIELKGLPVYDQIKNRRNVLLFGDSIGDIGMVKGFDYKNLIKIGFFNGYEKMSKSEYLDKFDILVLNDSNFMGINKILNGIF